MSDIKQRLNDYGAGYYRGQVQHSIVWIALFVALTVLVVFDPLNVDDLGAVYGYDRLLDCQVATWAQNPGNIDGFDCTPVPVPVRYGPNIPFAFLAVYFLPLLIAGLLVEGLMNSYRATRALARDLATRKTLGLLEEEKTEKE